MWHGRRGLSGACPRALICRVLPHSAALAIRRISLTAIGIGVCAHPRSRSHNPEVVGLSPTKYRQSFLHRWISSHTGARAVGESTIQASAVIESSLVSLRISTFRLTTPIERVTLRSVTC